MPSYKNYIKKILPIFGIILLFYIVYTLDLEKIKEIIFSTNPIYLLLLLTLTIPWLLLRNYTWQLIQKEQKIKLNFWSSLKIFLIGHFYCTFTPGYIGHILRVPYMKEKTNEPYGKLFVNILIEASLRMFALFVLFFIGAILLIGLFPNILTIGILAFVCLGLIIIYFFKKERGEKLIYFIIRNAIPKKYQENFYKFVNTFYSDFPKTNRLLKPFILSLLIWIIIFSQEYLIAYVFGIDIPYLSFILLFPIANLAGYIPFTIGGLGFREYTSILIFTSLYSVSSEEIFLLTLIGFILLDIVTGLFGFVASLTEFKEIKNGFLSKYS